MLKRISHFYSILTILSVVGTVLAMGSSLDPLTTFIAGMIGALILLTIAVVIGEVAQMKTQIELQTKLMRYSMKKRK